MLQRADLADLMKRVAFFYYSSENFDFSKLFMKVHMEKALPELEAQFLLTHYPVFQNEEIIREQRSSIIAF